MKNNDTLELCVYDDEGKILNYKELKEGFPKDLKFIYLGVKWSSHVHPWHKEIYPLKNFYSSVRSDNIIYPKTYKELFLNLKIILHEHAVMGTLGIDDEEGEFCPLIYKAENEFITMIDNILNLIK